MVFGAKPEILLMEEILNNHLGCIEPCKQWENRKRLLDHLESLISRIKNDARGKKHNSPKATAGQEVDVDIDDGSRYEPMEADPGGARRV